MLCIPLFMLVSTVHVLHVLEPWLAVACAAFLATTGIGCVVCSNLILTFTGAQVGRTLREMLFGTAMRQLLADDVGGDGKGGPKSKPQ